MYSIVDSLFDPHVFFLSFLQAFYLATSRTLLKPERQRSPLPCNELAQFLDKSPDKNK